MTRTEALPTGPDCHAALFGDPVRRPQEAVLIQIPRVQVRPDRRHPAARRVGELHARRPAGARRPRRRLKRGVRLAARALLGLGLVAFACSQYGYGHYDHDRGSPLRLLLLGAGRDGERRQPWAQARPAVVLTVEPTPATPDVPFDAAVVLPGYLLPDDGHEESTHEGS